MSIHRIKILLLKHKLLIILFPALVAVLVGVLVWNRPLEYTSRALLYTGFASGYNLESPESHGVSNFAAVESAFDNLLNTVNAQSTLEEVSLRLLALHLSASPSDTTGIKLPEEQAAYLNEIVPAAYRKSLLSRAVPDSLHTPDSLLHVLQADLQRNHSVLKEVVYSGNSPIGVSALRNNLQASRSENSDMLAISYKTTSPRLAQATLSLVIDSFIKQYRKTKTAEAASVVAYFDGQLEDAVVALRKKEQELEKFSSAKGIINYDEDSKAIVAMRQQIENQIQQEASSLAATEAALNQLNSKLSRVKEIAARSTAVNKLRDSLSLLESQLVLAQHNPGKRESAAQVQNSIRNLENRLRDQLGEVSVSSNTQDGVPSKMLLSSWIDAMLEVDKSKARINSLKSLQASKQSEFNTIIPAGVAITRLKRDIELAEQNYLEILHNLNSSKLREQNIFTSLNLKLLDEPNLPENAGSSKKKLLIILGFMAGLFLVLGYVVGKELLDTTIKYPEQSRSRIQLPFAGALPVMNRHNEATVQAEIQLLNQCINTINSHFREDASPFVIILFSTQPGDGKTFYGQELGRHLNESGYKTYFATPSDNGINQDLGNNTPLRVSGLQTFSEGNGSVSAGKTPYEVVLVELDSLNNTVLPFHLLKRADLSLVIVPAHRKWTHADDHILTIYRSNITHPVFAVLNCLEWAEVKRLMGKNLVKKAYAQTKKQVDTKELNGKSRTAVPVKS